MAKLSGVICMILVAEKEDSGDGASRPCSCWFHRWITAWDIWRGEVPVFASFEYELTPLWVWEE